MNDKNEVRLVLIQSILMMIVLSYVLWDVFIEVGPLVFGYKSLMFFVSFLIVYILNALKRNGWKISI